MFRVRTHRTAVGARHAAAAVLAIVLVGVLAACSSGSPSTSPSAAAGGLRVENAWARPSMGMDRAGAAYLVISNDTATDDALVGASSPAATTVEIHETTPDASGMMAMHPVDRIPLPAGSRTELKAGGFHIMLIGLKAPLEVGSAIEITLRFEKAAPITVTVPVKAG